MSDCPVMTVYDSGGESKTPPPVITIRLDNTTNEEIYQLCKFINSYTGIEYRVREFRNKKEELCCEIYLMNATRLGEAFCQLVKRVISLEQRIDDHDTALDVLTKDRAN